MWIETGILGDRVRQRTESTQEESYILPALLCCSGCCLGSEACRVLKGQLRKKQVSIEWLQKTNLQVQIEQQCLGYFGECFLVGDLNRNGQMLGEHERKPEPRFWCKLLVR